MLGKRAGWVDIENNKGKKAMGILQCVHMHEPFEDGMQPLPRLMDEELEARGGEGTCLRSHRSRGTL